MSSTAGPLSERSPNTTSPSKASSEPTKSINLNPTETMPSFAAAFSQKQVQGQATTYVSPSDNILSPTSKKLSAIKGRRFASGKPQSLFAKTVAKEGLKSQEWLDQETDKATEELKR